MHGLFRIVTGLVLLTGSFLQAAGPACPAGMPLGGFRVTVTRREGSVALPLNRINRLEEGDKIAYEPVVRNDKEKRSGEVALVLIVCWSSGADRSILFADPYCPAKPARAALTPSVRPVVS